MDFKKGQKVQAIGELGRREEARILECDIENFRVNFMQWSSNQPVSFNRHSLFFAI